MENPTQTTQAEQIIENIWSITVAREPLDPGDMIYAVYLAVEDYKNWLEISNLLTSEKSLDVLTGEHKFSLQVNRLRHEKGHLFEQDVADMVGKLIDKQGDNKKRFLIELAGKFLGKKAQEEA